MRTILKPAALAAVLSLLAAALPAVAGSGDVVSIALRDFNRNGKIDRAIVRISNPSRATWSVKDGSGFSMTYAGAPLRISDVFVASAASDPALIEVVLDEGDAATPATTSADGFELVYRRIGTNGASAAGTELSAIAAGDTGAGDTELDEAAPLLVSSSPAAGDAEVRRRDDLRLVFSEPVSLSSLVPSSSNNPGGWTFSSADGGTSVVVQHAAYRINATETFGIAAKDFAGNAVAAGSYPNPFTFRMSDDDRSTVRPNLSFSLSAPWTTEALVVGAPTVIAWHSTLPEVTQARLAVSVDGGQSYAAVATLPASRKTFVWYPASSGAAVQLRAEGLNATGAVVASSIVGPFSIAAGTPATLTVVSGPETTYPTASSATVTLKLDRAPASAAFSCGGTSYAVTSSGDRPARLVASLAGLPEGASYSCRFDLSDPSGTVTRVDVPAFRSGADTTGPAILEPAVLDAFDAAAGTARLSWTTDEPSTASVSYGPYLDYGRLATDAALSTAHAVTLSGLTPGAMHQARVTSVDARGNAAVSRDWYFVFLREGDLIKGTGAAVYRYTGGKRYAFPNADTYRSWYGDDFSKVLRVPDTQLGTIPLGGNVKMKEGVYLIKIQSDPKTYAVEPGGTLRWVQTESDARALYGSAWAKRVRDVDVSLFTDYAIGASLAAGEKPAGYAN